MITVLFKVKKNKKKQSQYCIEVCLSVSIFDVFQLIFIKYQCHYHYKYIEIVCSCYVLSINSIASNRRQTIKHDRTCSRIQTLRTVGKSMFELKLVRFGFDTCPMHRKYTILA